MNRAPLSPPLRPPGALKVTSGSPRVSSSAPHRWHGTLALDIVGSAAGECRNEHVLPTLELWHQALKVRPLQGASGWRTIEAGARLWLPGERQHFEWRQASRMNIVVVTPARIEQILERPYSKANLDRWRGLDFRDPFAARLVAALCDDVANNCPAGPLVGDSLTAALVAYLEAGPGRALPAESGPGPSPENVGRALRYIEENLAEPLRLADLAREAGCSPKQLGRAFRVQMGMLPHRYVLARRVECAVALIEASELGLAHVAQTVGFADQSQMTKIFQKLIGTTPGRVRKRLLDEPGSRQALLAGARSRY